jgi:hypothetical protein
MKTESPTELITIFDSQVAHLLEIGYSEMAGLSVKEFLNHIEPLKQTIEVLVVPEIDLDEGRLPFVIVIKSDLVSTTTALKGIKRQGKQGMTNLFPREPEDFRPIDSVAIPKQAAYLLVDIDRGKTTINLAPNEAMKQIVEAKRSALTIDEGVAILTQYPEFLMKNNCFSLLASRHSSDKRVPAIWINGKKHPNLGWCWEGNPHTWLGSASCLGRLI